MRADGGGGTFHKFIKSTKLLGFPTSGGQSQTPLFSRFMTDLARDFDGMVQVFGGFPIFGELQYSHDPKYAPVKCEICQLNKDLNLRTFSSFRRAFLANSLSKSTFFVSKSMNFSWRHYCCYYLYKVVTLWAIWVSIVPISTYLVYKSMYCKWQVVVIESIFTLHTGYTVSTHMGQF